MVQLDGSGRKDGASRRIYRALREQIASGTYAAGERLPSSRALAEELGVSRTTVTSAFDQLISEGYVQVRQGSRPVVTPNVAPAGANPTAPCPQVEHKLSAYAERVMELPPNVPIGLRPVKYDFRYGDLAPGDFPKLAWRKAVSAAILAPRERLGYDDPAGSQALRRALRLYLWRARGISCAVDQIVIVSGSQQALDIAARVLVDPGDPVVLEEPCYAMARNVLVAMGAVPIAVPCDCDGLDTSRLPDPTGVALACVTSSHQFPLGGVLSASRRRALLDWAEAGNIYVVEDDYDGEYRYDVLPIPPLHLSGPDRVIYVGTVSKTLSPTLRLGYMVLPPELVEPFTRCKQIADRHSASFEQEALAALIESGAYERHVRRMRRLNAERRSTFLGAMAEQFGSEVEIVGTSAGLHVVVWLNRLRAADAERFAGIARENDVGIYPVSRLFAVPTDTRAGFIFGYASMPVGLIGKGVEQLGKVVRGQVWG